MMRESGASQSEGIRLARNVVASLASAMAIACIISYFLDSRTLRDAATQVVANVEGDREKILALAHWVHGNKGSHENDSYFLFRSLRATPLQVLQGGGDCADKSRLLWAMLREAGIKSTMVMCFHRQSGVPTHTVVEAETGSGEHILVDPVYGLVFPKPFSRKYYGLLELRADPMILDRRLGELLATAPRSSPLRSYNPVSAAYDQASSFNWNRNGLTKAARAVLASIYGDGVYRLKRPSLLEEPKLLVSSLFLGSAAFVLIAGRLGSAAFARLHVTREVVAPCGH